MKYFLLAVLLCTSASSFASVSVNRSNDTYVVYPDGCVKK